MPEHEPHEGPSVRVKVFEDPVTGLAFRSDGRPAYTCPACGHHYPTPECLDPDVHGCEGEELAD